MTEKDMAVLAALAGFAWWTYVFLPLVFHSIPEDRRRTIAAMVAAATKKFEGRASV